MLVDLLTAHHRVPSIVEPTVLRQIELKRAFHSRIPVKAMEFGRRYLCRTRITRVRLF